MKHFLLFLVPFFFVPSLVSAASPTGTSTFRFNPTSLSGTNTQITGLLNTKFQTIYGFQISTSFSYTQAQPPIDILAASTTISIPSSELICPSNTVSHDTATKTVKLVVGCLVPIGTTFSTNNTEREIFNFALHTNSPGTVTFAFDNSSGGSKIEPPSADLLTIPPVTYTSPDTNFQASLSLNFSLQDQPATPIGTLQFLQNNQLQYTFASIPLTKTGAAYTYTTPQILNPNPISPYTLLLQIPYHLDRQISNITLVPGPNSLATTVPIRAGDFNCDNVFNLADISNMLSHYTAVANLKYDLTGDSIFTIRDIALLLSGYTSLSVSGDGPSRSVCTTP